MTKSIKGIGLYTDFVGTPDKGRTFLSWHFYWYTEIVRTDEIQGRSYPQTPYKIVTRDYLKDTANGSTWSDLLYRLWQPEIDAKTLRTLACVSDSPPAQQDQGPNQDAVLQGDLTIPKIIFPMAGSIQTEGYPVAMAVAISTTRDVVSPLVRFAVFDVAINRPVFTNTVSTGYLKVGEHRVTASEYWIPKIGEARTYRLVVTVDSDKRVIELQENNNELERRFEVRPVVPDQPLPSVITATVPSLWVTTSEISVNVTQRIDPVHAPITKLHVDIYRYAPGVDPNIRVPVFVGEQDVAPGQPILLPNGFEPGIVELRVWAESDGGWTPVPSEVTMNYVPPNTALASDETDYFLFGPDQGDSIEAVINLASGTKADMSIWILAIAGLPVTKQKHLIIILLLFPILARVNT